MRAPSILVALAALTLTSCGSLSGGSECCEATTAVDMDAAEAAPKAYRAAINTNDVDAIMATMTDDVVFLAAGAPPLLGKAAVREWVAGYVAAFDSHWDKRSESFVVAGDRAIERYSYTATDTPKAGGDAIVHTGWGLVVYRREADGVWRVSQDAFASDQP